MEKYYDIVIGMIKENRRYVGMEPILDKIAENVLKRSETVLANVTDESVLYSYLEKTVNTALITVPKRLNFHSPKIINNVESKICNPPAVEESAKTSFDTEKINDDIYTNSEKELENDNNIIEDKQEVNVDEDLIVKMINGNSISQKEFETLKNDFAKPEESETTEDIKEEETKEPIENTIESEIFEKHEVITEVSEPETIETISEIAEISGLTENIEPVEDITEFKTENISETIEEPIETVEQDITELETIETISEIEEISGLTESVEQLEDIAELETIDITEVIEEPTETVEQNLTELETVEITDDVEDVQELVEANEPIEIINDNVQDFKAINDEVATDNNLSETITDELTSDILDLDSSIDELESMDSEPLLPVGEDFDLDFSEENTEETLLTNDNEDTTLEEMNVASLDTTDFSEEISEVKSTKTKSIIAEQDNDYEKSLENLNYDTDQYKSKINIREIVSEVDQYEANNTTKNYKAIWNMRFVEHKSISEISKKMNIAEDNVIASLNDMTGLVEGF